MMTEVWEATAKTQSMTCVYTPTYTSIYTLIQNKHNKHGPIVLTALIVTSDLPITLISTHFIANM